VSSSGGALFSVALLTLLLVLLGPTLVDRGIHQIRDGERRRRVHRHVHVMFGAASRYVGWMTVRAVVMGGAAGMIAAGLGSDAPTLVGVWFAACSIVPIIGFVIAVLPIAALLAVSSPGPAAALLFAVVLLQGLDARLLQPRVEARSVHVGPALTLVAVFLGAQLYGVGGALVLLAAAVAGPALVVSLTSGRAPLTEAMRSLTPDDMATMVPTRAAAVIGDDGNVTWWYELGWRTPLTVVVAGATVIAAVGLIRSGPVMLLIAMAALLSFAVDPVVGKLQAVFHTSRGVAVAGLAVFGLATVAGVGVLVAPQAVEQAASVPSDLPARLAEVKGLPLVGSALADQRVDERLTEWVNQLPDQMSRDPSGLLDGAASAGGVLAAMLIFSCLFLAIVLEGPRLVDLLRQLLPPRHLQQLEEAGRLVGHTAGRYFSGSLVLAILQGVQVFVTGLVFGVPLTPVAALWAAVWTLVPQVGGAVGGLPFVLLAFSHSASAGVWVTIIFGVYLVIANNVLLPVIVGKAVDLSALATTVATIAGFTLLGVPGAVLAVPVLGAGKAIWLQRRPQQQPDPFLRAPD